MPEYLHPGVYVQEESSGAKPIEGASTSTACFVGTTVQGQPNRPTMVTSWAQFSRVFGDLRKDQPLPLAVYQFFQNGGRRAYILRVLSSTAVPAKIDVSVPEVNAAVTVQALGGGRWGNDIRVQVRVSQFSHKQPTDTSPDDKRPYLYDFRVLVKDSEGVYQPVETHMGLGAQHSGDKFYATIINRDSSLIRVRPTNGAFPELVPNKNSKADDNIIPWDEDKQATPPVAGVPVFDLKGGLDSADDKGPGTPVQPPNAGDYLKSMAELDRLDDVSILVTPAAPADVIANGITYVESRPLREMIYIIDPPDDPTDVEPSVQVDNVKKLVNQTITNKSSWAALYFPWVEIADPYTNVSGATRFAPPSGMIAGLYARTDNTRGVWKAPAGTEANLNGALGLAAKVSDADQDTLNPIGVNCIRQFATSGIVVWGSRTLATNANPEYRYVPVRRMTNFLKASLYRGTQWVVFEPNDEPLWSAIRFNLNAFMTSQFRAGAFQGSKPSDAFLVKCDADNNIQATIDQGQVHILVAFAPLKPAEFVIIHIQQIRKQ